ncbi:hypothetical protein Tco_0296767 [Tanacetum coccineum]
MPVEMGTYDVIIDCAKKIVRIPFGSEILIFHGDGSRNKRGTRLNIISCTKAKKYLLQGCHVFLAHITIKETGDKSKKKQLQDVPIVKNFPEVFPKDLPDTIMSDSEHSTVTYTSVSADDLDMGSPGIYVPGPEEPEQAPPSPTYVPFVLEPVSLEFLPVDDEIFPAEE